MHLQLLAAVIAEGCIEQVHLKVRHFYLGAAFDEGASFQSL